MGATTEFMSADEIKRVYPRGVREIIGGGAFGWQRGEVTDDTQMAICVMQAAMASEDNGQIDMFKFISECERRFVEWYESKPKDIGNTCAEGILRLKDGKLPTVVSSLGNGGLMRAWPLAVVGEVTANVIQNNITHMNQTCIQAIEKYSESMQHCLQSGFSGRYANGYMQPTGCVVNTLNNALLNASLAITFEEGIVWPVNDGGDSDTIACVTGGLVGARFGFRAIPKKWVHQLDSKVRKVLDQYVDWACGYLERKQARLSVSGFKR